MSEQFETDRFYFERCEISDDEDSDFDYGCVEEDDGTENQDQLENLDNVVKSLEENAKLKGLIATPEKVGRQEEQLEVKSTGVMVELPENYIRNYLMIMEMPKTLDAFQAEWFEMEVRKKENRKKYQIITNIKKQKDTKSNTNTEEEEEEEEEKGYEHFELEKVNDLYVMNLQLVRTLISSKLEGEKLKNVIRKQKEIITKQNKQKETLKILNKRLIKEKDNIIKLFKKMKIEKNKNEENLKKLTKKYEEVVRGKLSSQFMLKRTQDLLKNKQECENIQSSNMKKVPMDEYMPIVINTVNNNTIHGTADTTDNTTDNIITNTTTNTASVSKDSVYNSIDNDKNNNQNYSDDNNNFNLNCCSDEDDNIYNSNNNNNNKRNNKNKYDSRKNKNFDERNKTNPNNNQFSNKIPTTNFKLKNSSFPPECQFSNKLFLTKNSCYFIDKGEKFQHLSVVKAHQLPVTCMSLNGKLLASGSEDLTFKLWDPINLDLKSTTLSHDHWLSGISLGPCGSRLATVSGDLSLKIWDISTSICLFKFTGHLKAVWGVDWHFSGNFIATCSLDHNAKLWDLNSLHCIYTLRGHKDSVNSVEFLDNSNLLLTSSSDHTISLWDARQKIAGRTYKGHKYGVNSARFNLKGNLIGSCDSGGAVIIWDVREGKELNYIDLNKFPFTCCQDYAPLTTPPSLNHCCFDPTSRVLVVTPNNGLLIVIRIDNDNITELQGHRDSIQSVCYDEEGRYIYSAGNDGTIRQWG